VCEALRVHDVSSVQRGLPHDAHLVHSAEEDAGRGERSEVGMVVLAASKYDGSKNTKTGPATQAQRDRDLVIRMATENPGWGYTKIRDALRNGLKIEIGRTTVASILREAGIEPAPERRKSRTGTRFTPATSSALRR